jgi:hypothetical protein
VFTFSRLTLLEILPDRFNGELVDLKQTENNNINHSSCHSTVIPDSTSYQPDMPQKLFIPHKKLQISLRTQIWYAESQEDRKTIVKIGPTRVILRL